MLQRLQVLHVNIDERNNSGILKSNKTVMDMIWLIIFSQKSSQKQKKSQKLGSIQPGMEAHDTW